MAKEHLFHSPWLVRFSLRWFFFFSGLGDRQVWHFSRFFLESGFLRRTTYPPSAPPLPVVPGDEPRFPLRGSAFFAWCANENAPLRFYALRPILPFHSL